MPIVSGARRSVNSFRILSLDGGGVRGIFSAAVIAQLEHDLDIRLVDHVDLVVGTSTGGIIGLGLAAGKSGEQMRNFYAQEGKRIFGRPRSLPRRLRQPKYNRRVLDEVLRREFGEQRLNDLNTSVCITAHELVAGTTRVWKDDHHHELSGGGDQLVWKVAAATAAAPTYFAPVQLGNADSHVDGGIWANNPALVGITEAVRYAGRSLDDIRLLSIGSTTRTFQVQDHEQARRMGLLAWVKEARELLLGGSVSMASARQAELLLPPGAYLRLDSERATDVPLDDYEKCAGLREVGEQAARLHRHQVRTLLSIGTDAKSAAD
jgi:patatin-like phospholipase/acyl hydrolase